MSNPTAGSCTECPIDLTTDDDPGVWGSIDDGSTTAVVHLASAPESFSLAFCGFEEGFAWEP